MNDDDQEMQQSVVSKDCGDDDDALAEDKKSLMLEEEDMLAIPKLGEGGDLVGSERRIVRECYGMEVEEDDHCLKEGESGYEDEDGDLKQIEVKDDSTEGDISTKSCIARYSNALESSEESMQLRMMIPCPFQYFLQIATLKLNLFRLRGGNGGNGYVSTN